MPVGTLFIQYLYYGQWTKPNRLTDIKVHETPLGLSSPVSVGGHIEGSEGVGFFSVVGLLKSIKRRQ